MIPVPLLLKVDWFPVYPSVFVMFLLENAHGGILAFLNIVFSNVIVILILPKRAG